jgi:hypothetical protein
VTYITNELVGLDESEAGFFNDFCENQLKTVLRSNCEAKTMARFYRILSSKETEDKNKAQYNIKADQLQKNVDFNNSFLDYLKSYEVK